MSDYIYRFRPIGAVLDKFHELENQEIYFSPPHELNDPTDGYQDFYWEGDQIVWQNFFKHYLRCLYHTIAISHVLGSEKVIEPHMIDILDNFKESPDADSMLQPIYERFWENENAKEFPKWLSGRTKIRKNELCFYLKLLHPHSLKIVYDSMAKYVPSLKSAAMTPIVINPHSITSLIKDNNDEIIFEGASHEHATQELALRYSMSRENHSLNSDLIILDFPEIYLKESEKLVHPNWCTASFVSACDSPTMWGHYANGHSGVCLKFKTTSENGTNGLKLGRFYTSNEQEQPIKYDFYNFNKVRYSERFNEINFFRNIGRLSIPKLIKYWYYNDTNERSVCGQEILGRDDSWRMQYWKNYYEGINTKLTDWSYEQEYRLVTDDTFYNVHSTTDRRRKYDFRSLDGVIFGSNMKMNDKLKIIEIIEKKCIQTKRNHFNFYQSRYNRRTGKMDILSIEKNPFEHSAIKMTDQ